MMNRTELDSVPAAVHPPQFTHSYVDAMHQVLSANDWFTLPKYMLSGMTAFCFRLSVHRQLHRDSPTAYNWMAEHTVAADLIGIVSTQAAGFHFAPTFPLYQKQAILEIRKSLEQGTPVICWKDQFVVITRFDDHKQVFYYNEISSRAELELPYDQLGRNESPYWHCQIFEGQIRKDLRQVLRESFLQAVYKAEVHDPMLPESQYACGLQAYDAMLDALSRNTCDVTGAYETLVFYAASKQDTSCYTRDACKYWPELEPTASHYEHLSAVYVEIAARLSQNPVHSTIYRRPKELLDLIREAKQSEAEAIQSIRLLLREPIENRFHDVGLR
ncbi:hypothetical protein [Paenibacillus borealis]|uniref:Butirosin biosynthesis protein H N-terminal domain-containing protein n=1 Tax=Paenibacillus borealis TaxID=160799 RepID=A0A089LBM9_PAEBO|nr:hypothetical protein [Paenibacillus borealis]AIQ58232.1 hypothetical protein PBOR_15805 [Paenibacillus borealis]